MSPYFHAVFHNRHQLHITEKATQLALDKKKKPNQHQPIKTTKDCNDMLQVLEWVFFPVN